MYLAFLTSIVNVSKTMYHLLYRFIIVYVSYMYKIPIPSDRMATYCSCIVYVS